MAGCGGFKCCGYVLTAEAKERERKKAYESQIKIEAMPVFCGNKNVKQVTAPLRGTQMFICNVCGADVCFYGTEYDAKARIAWNRRSETEKSK